MGHGTGPENTENNPRIPYCGYTSVWDYWPAQIINDDRCFTVFKDMMKNSETCIRYSKPKQKPDVSLPMASNYNDTALTHHQETSGDCEALYSLLDKCWWSSAQTVQWQWAWIQQRKNGGHGWNFNTEVKLTAHGAMAFWKGVIKPSLKSWWKWRETMDVTGGQP